MPLRFARRLCTRTLLLLVSLCASQAWAQTTVPGAVAADTRWTLAESPYLVSGNLAVQNGAILTIDAGVVVYMGPGAGLTVQAGAIKAQGTASSPVRVLSDSTRLGAPAAPGDWNQWVFTAGAVNTRLEHVLFEHGKGLAVNGSAPVFNYLELRNHQGAAITVDLAASPSGVGTRRAATRSTAPRCRRATSPATSTGSCAAFLTSWLPGWCPWAARQRSARSPRTAWSRAIRSPSVSPGAGWQV